MFGDILTYPDRVATEKISENDYCRRLLEDKNFRFPNFLELRTAFEENPKLVDSWLKYSEDRRSSPSFYFRKSGPKYELGYLFKGGVDRLGKYQEASIACALFIMLEIEPRFLNLTFVT